MNEITIRKGNVGDADSVVRVTTATWLTTYKGLMPDEILEQRVKTIDERVVSTAKSIEQNDNLFVAQDRKQVVGVVTYGRSRNDEYPDDAEVYSVYVLKEYQGTGVGKRLFVTAIGELASKGFKNAFVNVLDGNSALNFYQKLGGIIVGSRTDDYGSFTVKENIARFIDVAKLCD